MSRGIRASTKSIFVCEEQHKWFKSVQSKSGLFSVCDALPRFLLDGKDAMNYSNASRPEVLELEEYDKSNV